MNNPENNQSRIVPEAGTVDGQMGYYRIESAVDPIANQNQTPNDVNVDIHVKHNRASRGVRKFVAGTVLAGLALYGGYNVVKGMFDDGGSKLEAEVALDQTRVTVYENPQLLIAGIQSDLDLTLSAGYDRTGPIPGIDINPINNEYTLDQQNLTTDTSTLLSVESLEVTETNDAIVAELSGDMNLSQTSIDWLQEDFAGADIKRSSLSFGNELKDKIDNQALEILQASGSVTASCALRESAIQEKITVGVVNFLKVVNPELSSEVKPLTVKIADLENQADSIYAESIDQLYDVVDDIQKSYKGKNDYFRVDTTNIENCNEHNIVFVPDQPQ